jgi:hypothetical protein
MEMNLPMQLNFFHKENVKMKQTKKQIHEQEIEQVKNRLREMVKPGDTVYTKLDHVSRSGMYRVITLYVMIDNEPNNINWSASQLLEGYDTRHEGCKASGCGMDMGFHLVYNLSYSLFGDGFMCLGEKCPSNDHSNGDRDYSPHMHHSGGYALKHRWM